jgi:CRP-like cAMP-binding protein
MICDSSLFRLLEEKVRIHQKMGFAVIRSLMKRLRRLTDHLLLIRGGKIQDIKLTQCRREGIMDLRQQ